MILPSKLVIFRIKAEMKLMMLKIARADAVAKEKEKQNGVVHR